MQYVLDNRRQIWAEAHARALTDVAHHLDAAEIAAHAPEVEQRRISDTWEHLIDTYLLSRTHATTYDLLTQCVGIEPGKHTKADQMRVGCILRAMNWVKTTDGKKRGYARR